MITKTGRQVQRVKTEAKLREQSISDAERCLPRKQRKHAFRGTRARRSESRCKRRVAPLPRRQKVDAIKGRSTSGSTRGNARTHAFRLFHFFRLSLLTNPHICAKINCVKKIAELCNGSTADSDSVRLGSNPGSAAKTKGRVFALPFVFTVTPPKKPRKCAPHLQALRKHPHRRRLHPVAKQRFRILCRSQLF